jgi:hypothetical protein
MTIERAVAIQATALIFEKEEIAMKPHQFMIGLLLILAATSFTEGQLLNGDTNFPVLNESRWGISINDVRDLCIRRHVEAVSTDSAIIIRERMLGFAAHTEFKFDQDLKVLKLVQIKFSEATKTVIDSVTNHFTRLFGRAPLRTVKEKSVLIMTLRMELASWRSTSGLVSLVTAMRGDSPFDASLVLMPPTAQQAPSGPK